MSVDSASTHHAILEEFIRNQSDVITMTRKTAPIMTTPTTISLGEGEQQYVSMTSNNSKAIQSDDLLFRRGKMSNSCIIILSGYVKVLTGAEEKESLHGPWSTLGADALLVPEGTYIPDFTAFIDSDELRFVRVSVFKATMHSLHFDEWPSIKRKRNTDEHMESVKSEENQIRDVRTHNGTTYQSIESLDIVLEGKYQC